MTSRLSLSDKAHRAFGKHSNIPECCIDFFIKKWLPNKSAAFEKAYWKKIEKAEKKLRIKCWKYIPCEDCLDNLTRVKLHICGKKCPPDTFEYWENYAATHDQI